LVKKKDAKCNVLWFEEKRCSQFPSCITCDFKDVPFTKEAIKAQIEKERNAVKELSEKRKEAIGPEKEKLEIVLIDKIQGIMIMQNMLISHFGWSAIGSARDIIKGMREIKSYKRQMAKLAENK
jgi:hypothetical protein